LKELCNQVCKSAIKESIEEEEKKKALMKERPDLTGDVEMMVDAVPMLTKRHFEAGLAGCRISVNELDLAKYDDFKRKFDPTFNSVKGGNVVNKIRWPDEGTSSSSSSTTQQAKKDEDLDLYS